MYEQFYRLKNTPFRLSPDPAFFFGSQGHNRALAYLRYGLAQKEGFIVITGAPGTGKTTLARALLQEVSREKIIIAELNTTHLGADDVMRMVAASFGLEHEGLPKATLLKRLEAFCISRYRAGYHVLLLVDEAQSLPHDSLEELRMLSNFYLGKDALIQIFLLGQEQFRTMLYSSDLEQLRQRVVASSHLDPLGLTETRKYIEHRLSLSGWNNNPKISDRAFARIYALTKGVPRRINTFCERLMLFGALEELAVFHDDTVKAVAEELMYEVSAKGVKLSDINPGVPKVEIDAVESLSPEIQLSESDHDKAKQDKVKNVEELVDSEMLSSFSDDVAEDNTKASDDASNEDSVVDDTTVLDEFSEDDEFATPEKDPVEGAADGDSSVDVVPERPDDNSKAFPLRIVARGNAAKETFDPMPQTEAPLVDTKPDWWELVAMAAAFQNNPEKFKSISSSKAAIPSGVSDCLKIAIGKMRVPEYLRTGELNAMTDQEIREALRYYIKNALLTSAADYYRRLGVDSNASFEQIRSHYKYLFRLFQPDKEQNASNWDETFTRRINQAYGTLRSTEKRKEYDAFLASLKKRADKISTENEAGKSVPASTRSENTATHAGKNTSITRPALKSKAKAAAPSETRLESLNNKKAFPVGLALAIGGLVGILVAGAFFFLQSDIKFQIVVDAGSAVDEPVSRTPDLSAAGIPMSSEFVGNAATPAVGHEGHDALAREIDESKVPDRPHPNEPETIVLRPKAGEKTPVSDVGQKEIIKSDSSIPATAPVNKEVPVKASNKPPVVKEKLVASKSPVVHPNNNSIEKTASTAIKSRVVPEPRVTAVKKVEIPKPEPAVRHVQKTSKTATPEPVVQKDVMSKPVTATKPDAEISSPASVSAESNVVLSKAANSVSPEVLENSALPKALPKQQAKKQIGISQKRLKNFITRFSLAYEEGDLDAFMTFFTDTASTNDARDKAAIRAEYKKLFGTTEMRVIDLDNLAWKIKKQKAVGKGQFDVTVLGEGAREMKKFSGLIKLEVVNIKDKLMLNGMYHAYGADE